MTQDYTHKDRVIESLNLTLPLYVWCLTMNKYFRRLKNISQLDFIGAAMCTKDQMKTHTRWDHCIGTAHYTYKIARRLHKSNKITEKEVRCITVAALFHDIGHGPYSHAWDRILEKVEKNHEIMSVEIAKEILQMKTICDWFTESDIQLIVRMIVGKHDDLNMPGKQFLIHIINNEISGIDTDKQDYLQRDIYYIYGSKAYAKYTNIFSSIYDTCDVSNHGDLIFDEKLWTAVETMFDMRHKMIAGVFQAERNSRVTQNFVEIIEKIKPAIDLFEPAQSVDVFNTLDDGIIYKIWDYINNDSDTDDKKLVTSEEFKNFIVSANNCRWIGIKPCFVERKQVPVLFYKNGSTIRYNLSY